MNKLEKLGSALLLACLCSGCAMQRAVEIDQEAGTTTRYTGISFFNKSALEGLSVGKRSGKTSHVFSLEKGNTETQPEAIKAMAEAIGIAAGTAAKTAVKP
jgi:hypothetical protein